MRVLYASVAAWAALTLVSGAAIPPKCSGQATLTADHCVCNDGVACTGKYCVIGHAKAKHTELHGYNPGKCVDCTCGLPEDGGNGDDPAPASSSAATWTQGSAMPFCDALKKAARPATPEPAPIQSVHVIVANKGVMPLVENLLCSMRRLGIRNFAVLAMDSYGCSHLAAHGFIGGDGNDGAVCIEYAERMIEQMKRYEPDTFKHEAQHLTQSMHNVSKWATPVHKIMINTKLYAALDALECQLGVFVTDADIVFLEDPMVSFTKVLREDPRVQMVFQDDTTDQFDLSLNSGFFYMRPTTHNTKFMRSVIEVFGRDGRFWFIDQARVNVLLANGSFTDKNIWHRLPPRPFPNGAYIHKMMKASEQFGAIKPDSRTYAGVVKIIAVHANWSDSMMAKLKMLQNTGIWLLELETESCYAGSIPSALDPDFQGLIDAMRLGQTERRR